MPHIIKSNEKRVSIATGMIGKYKNEKWAFQREWRYRITLLPFEINQPIDLINQDFLKHTGKMIKGQDVQPLPYYDMAIDSDAFEQMEITTSPRISEGNKTILKVLAEKYNPSLIIHDSSLLGLI